LGAGALNLPAVLKAAATVGARGYFVEQESTAGDPLESLRKSFQYLAGL
jgi:hypothetical protein